MLSGFSNAIGPGLIGFAVRRPLTEGIAGPSAATLWWGMCGVASPRSTFCARMTVFEFVVPLVGFAVVGIGILWIRRQVKRLDAADHPAE